LKSAIEVFFLEVVVPWGAEMVREHLDEGLRELEQSASEDVVQFFDATGVYNMYYWLKISKSEWQAARLRPSATASNSNKESSSESDELYLIFSLLIDLCLPEVTWNCHEFVSPLDSEGAGGPENDSHRVF
jgi:hypothetical protein